MNKIHRVLHNAVQHIQHPIHAEKRKLESRTPPVSQHGPVSSDPAVLSGADQTPVPATNTQQHVHRHESTVHIRTNDGK